MSPFEPIKLWIFESNRTNFEWIEHLKIWLHPIVWVESNEFWIDFHQIFWIFYALSNQSNHKFSNRIKQISNEFQFDSTPNLHLIYVYLSNILILLSILFLLFMPTWIQYHTCINGYFTSLVSVKWLALDLLEWLLLLLLLESHGDVAWVVFAAEALKVLVLEEAVVEPLFRCLEFVFWNAVEFAEATMLLELPLACLLRLLVRKVGLSVAILISFSKKFVYFE